jgi:hypothetical protein
MSHLAEVYAKDLGVKIGKPFFAPHFFPVVDENYITLHHDNSIQAKEYDYWEEVIIIVKSVAPEIKFIQIGSGEEPKIKNADKFIQTKSFKQSAYIIKNALMHVGTDSSPVHIASALGKPIVSIYAHTYAKTCDPIWGNKDDHTIIESHRDGNKPSYSTQESAKTINLIKPEEIANAILSKLNKEPSKRETLYVGDKYKDNFFHVIPDHKYSLVDKNVVLRFDLLHEEENAGRLFRLNKVAIVTKKPVQESILSKPNIDNISYFAEEFDADFIRLCKKHGVALRLICTNEEFLSDQRFKFFDESIILIDEAKKIEDNKKKLNLNNKDFVVKSYSLYLKNKNAYPSLYEANGKNNLDDIFVDLDKLMIYTN